MDRPNFVVVCDHGIQGGLLAPVARFEWSAEQVGIGGREYEGSWVLPLQFTGARLDVLSGDDLARQDRGDEVTRTHLEIPCQEPRCSQRDYRGDETRFQTLANLVVDTPELHSVLAQRFSGCSFDERAVVVTLAALLWVRDTLAKRGQPV